ncbi:hypothetical protein A3Q56_07936 [Intoshia linei]|uniref:Histone deacetylase interacting domain-containing protein n=1 Tax=Intoshia linei TaxID=1819745 RepID=A0A177AQR9_9BILA|nr:hypothetical protein A3Q56_07936 [Intoshia linei]
MNIIDGHCFMDMVFDYFQTNTELYELLLKIICGKNFEEKRVLVNSIAPNFTSCVKHTDGYYYFLEDDVRLPKSSYRNDLCNSVLNETCVIKPAALDLTEKKRNIEIIPIENLTNIEEERFETDNILGLTYDIINLFKVLCNHMSSLSVNDAKKFTVDAKFGGDSEILPTIAIKRIYGGAFDAIYKSCLINPTVAIPVVLRRLEQKYEEWNHIKSKYNYIWRRETFANLNYMINSEINANKSLMEKRIAPPQVLNNFTEYISEQPNKIRQISLSVFTKGYGDVYSKFVKLFVSYLEKKSIFTQNTIDRMVITICKFYPDLFGLGNCSFYPTTDFDSDVNDDSNQALHQTNLEKNSSFVKWNDSVPLDYNDKYKNLAIFFGDETFAVSMVYIAIVLNNIIAMIKLHKDVNEEHVPRYKLNCNETISKILKMCKSHPNRTDLDRFYYELERLITRTDDSAEVYFKNKFRKDAELILTLPKLFEHLSYNLQDIVNDSNRLIMMKSFYKYMNNGYSGFEEYHHKILEINAPQNGSEIIEITCHCVVTLINIHAFIFPSMSFSKIGYDFKYDLINITFPTDMPCDSCIVFTFL